jgi:capsular exopolysaccharide synthesis family protein
MGQSGTDSALELNHYLTLLRTRKWLVLGVAAGVLLVVLLLSILQTPIYQGEARVLFDQLPQVPSSVYIPPSTLATEAELARSAPVAERVIQELRLKTSASSLIAHVTVTPVGIDSQVLIIDYSSPDPALARDAATSFAENYLLYRRERAFNALRDASEGLQARVQELQSRSNDLTREIREAQNSGDDARVASLQANRNALGLRLAALKQRLNNVLPENSANLYGKVIDPASLPSSPTSPNFSRNILLGLLAGLILGVSAALLRERLDERLRGRDDVEIAAQARVLAVVPRFESFQRGDATPRPVLLLDPAAGASESFRNLRTSLEFLLSRSESKTIMVTSPSVGEGKTVTTVNLAVAAAQAGSRTLLVSADLRRPTLEGYFGIPNKAGLSSWLVGLETHVESLIHPTEVTFLDLLPSGPIPPNPAELLVSHRLADLIAEMDRNYDVVLFDSPPALPVTDGIILASRIGRTLLVVNATKTRRMAVMHAREKIQGVGATVVGAVLNAVDYSSSGDYYQTYSYSSYSSQSDKAQSRIPRRKASS